MRISLCMTAKKCYEKSSLGMEGKNGEKPKIQITELVKIGNPPFFRRRITDPPTLLGSRQKAWWFGKIGCSDANMALEAISLGK